MRDEVHKPSAEQLIAEHIGLDDKIKAANKQVAAYLAPFKQRLQEIEAELLSMLNASTSGDKASFSTDSGTAYISHLLNVSVDPDGEKYVNQAGEEQVGKMALLDFALENWNDIGAELLLIQPQKDAVKAYMESHDGKPPSGLKIGWFSRVNVRRS